MSFYIVPITGHSTNFQNNRQPAYICEMPVDYIATDYGDEDTMIVDALTDIPQDTFLRTLPGVIGLPRNLDNTVGGNLATVQNALESLNIPGDWVTSGMTYREVIQFTKKIFHVCQRIRGVFPNFRFFDTSNLNTVFSTLPQAKQDKINQWANSFAGQNVPPNWMIRQILKYVANHFDELA